MSTLFYSLLFIHSILQSFNIFHKQQSTFRRKDSFIGIVVFPFKNQTPDINIISVSLLKEINFFLYTLTLLLRHWLKLLQCERFQGIIIWSPLQRLHAQVRWRLIWPCHSLAVKLSPSVGILSWERKHSTQWYKPYQLHFRWCGWTGKCLFLPFSTQTLEVNHQKLMFPESCVKHTKLYTYQKLY